MKIRRLSFGAEARLNLAMASDTELKALSRLAAYEGLLLIRGQPLPIERLRHIVDVFGLISPLKIGAAHPKAPQIVRVTNKHVGEGKRGLFPKGPLRWHCGQPLSYDPEECVVFYCKDPSASGGETEFACGRHAFSLLKDSERQEMAAARARLSRDPRRCFLQAKLYKNYEAEEISLLKKLSERKRRPSGQGSKEGEAPIARPLDKRMRSHSDFLQAAALKPLLVRHPVSRRMGLYFPPYHVSGIIGLKNPCKEAEMFHILKENYIGAKGRFYRHKWERGDMILACQIHSLHRRFDFSGPRELLRAGFWHRESKGAFSNTA